MKNGFMQKGNNMEKKILQLEKRILKLEAAVFRKKTGAVEQQQTKDFSGASGGLRFLITKKFFGTPKTLAEIRAGLEDQGYHYSIQAAQTALNRFSRTGNQLVTFKKGGKKVYAKRK